MSDRPVSPMEKAAEALEHSDDESGEWIVWARTAVLAFLEAAAEDDETVEAIARANFAYEFKGTPEEHKEGADGWCTDDWMDTIRDSFRWQVRALAARQREENDG